MRVPARAKKTLDDVDANDANDDETTRMTFDDGRPLIDVSTAMSKASVKRSSSIGPPVARPNVMRSRAATLAAGTAFARAVRDVRRAYGDLEEETGYPYGAAPGTHGEEGGFRDGSDDDARGFGPAEW